MNCIKFCTAAFTALVLTAISAGELSFKFDCGKDTPFAKVGEKVTITGSLLLDGKPAAGQLANVYFLFNGKTIKYLRKADASKPFVFEYTPKTPGWISLRIYAADKKGRKMATLTKRNGKTKTNSCYGGFGVMVEPEKLVPTMPEPEDFDKFWNGVKTELAKVPLKVIEKKQVKNKNVDIFDIKIDCAGDKPVSGYLCMPKNAKPKSLPAILSFHGAGVRSSSRPISRAMQGFISLDINALGIENGHPAKFYIDLQKNLYLPKGRQPYSHWGKNDRNTFFFKGMYMRVLRALEYVKSLPEWNGRHLVVIGSSQGGAQVLTACALDKDVTFAKCEVPAMCDHSGCLEEHISGWPKLYNRNKQGKPDMPEVAVCAAYYDGVNFAKRIKCPIYFSTGGIDFTCPPTSVYRAYNNVPAGVFKSIVFTPGGNHGGSKNKLFENALKKHIEK